jgi:hypothetical protein
VSACSVAVENLQEKEVDRRHRIQQSVSPNVTHIAAGLFDSSWLKLLNPIRLESTENFRETWDHPWTSCSDVMFFLQ